MKLTISKQPCPSCTSSDAYHEWEDGHGYCFACRTYFKGKAKSLSDEWTYEYLPWRGITRQTFEFYGAKSKIAENGEPISIGFPYANGSFKVRHLGHKDFYSRGEIAKAGLFGQDKFDSGGMHKYITITEGELDACSMYQVLRRPVVSVQSAATAKRDCIVAREWLGRFERIYLAFDNDAAGREACRAVASLFDYGKVFVVKYDRRKDANEYLEAGEQDELVGLWNSAKKYLPETIVSSFSDFKRILAETPSRGVPYPFPTLTEKTYGIKPKEIILVTGLEGVGKTAVMHAFEMQLLKETKDAIGAIYLEEPMDKHLKYLAGLHLGCPAHFPDTSLTVGQIDDALQQAIGSDDRLHLYSHYGSNDPDVLLDTIRFLVAARECRYILLDHISMVVSGLLGDDERKLLDYLATRLDMMVQELGFSLIIVSHVNDNGETRGSRYISKIAHTRIDLLRDVRAGSNLMYLNISKNRDIGKTGPAGVLAFDSKMFKLSELIEKKDDSPIIIDGEKDGHPNDPWTRPNQDNRYFPQGGNVDSEQYRQV